MGVLILGSEIKIGAGGCELFVVDLEGEEGVCVCGEGELRGGQEMDTPLVLPPRHTATGGRWRQMEGF